MDITNQEFGMDGDSETDSSEVMNSEEDGISEMDMLDISEAQADANLAAAGSEVREEKDRISMEENHKLIESDVDCCLDEIVEELCLPYALADFQRITVNALAQLKNVVLVSPTGSGKMNVPLLTTLVLRARLKNPKGVGIITQPLTSIMNEKKENDICPIAVLSMTGQLTATEVSDDATLSCLLDDLLEGKFPVILGHPESFDTKLGQRILRELQRLDRIMLLCIDEFHIAYGHWDNFRQIIKSNFSNLNILNKIGLLLCHSHIELRLRLS